MSASFTKANRVNGRRGADVLLEVLRAVVVIVPTDL
jgi:hypothetical protein